MKLRSRSKKIIEKVKEDNEKGARRAILEDLFYDFNKSRAQVYKMNFFRGIFFGLGSVVGGTIVVAILVWFMSLFVDWPGIGDSVRAIQESITAGE